MKTKFDVGQTVLLKVTVKEITVTEDGAIYSIMIPNKKSAIKVHERELEGACKEE